MHTNTYIIFAAAILLAFTMAKALNPANSVQPLLFASAVFLTFTVPKAVEAGNNLQPLLDAVRQVESGGRKNPPDGDSGRAIGSFQIWFAYWHDATHDAAGRRIHPGKYQDCRSQAYAEQVVRWYWMRYASGVADPKSLAALHHLGPHWKKKPEAAEAYWKKVQAVLKGKS